MATTANFRPMWVRLFPAPDIAGRWLADGVEVGWMTDGRNRLDAVSRFIEGMQVMELEHRAAGRDVMSIGPSPLEDWPECARKPAYLLRFRPLTVEDLTGPQELPEYVAILAVPIPNKRLVQARGAALERLLRRSYLVVG